MLWIYIVYAVEILGIEYCNVNAYSFLRICQCYSYECMLLPIVFFCYKDGSTALHEACGNGCTEVVKLLLANNANVLATNDVRKIFL